MISRPTLLELREIADPRGMLTFAQDANLPFAVKRLFTIYQVAPGATRGGHAHKRQHQLLFLMGGAAKVLVDDGRSRQTIMLERPSQALYVPPLLWLELSDFTPGAACTVLASDVYDEGDYIRDHAQFLKLAG